MRIYEREFKVDPVISRYQILLVLRRAETNDSILSEHRASIARDAGQLAEQAITRFRNDKNLYEVYLQIGRAIVNLSGKWDVFDTALEKAKAAENIIIDPDMVRFITKYEVWAHRRGIA